MSSELFQSAIMRQLKPALSIFVLLTVLTGILYPLIVMGIAQVAFPRQANGEMVVHDNRVVGSDLIGQPFTSPRYFWGRPSATSPFPYNASLSSGSNLGPSNHALTDAVKSRVEALRAADPGNTQPIPVDLVTASGSGLDPDISVAAAYYQAPRIAHERNLTEENVRALVARYTEGRQFGILGEPRVNVLRLNLALDDLGAPTARNAPSSSAQLPQTSENTVFGLRMSDWLQLTLFFGVLFALVVPFGRLMARVYRGEHTILTPVMKPFERWLLRTSGVRTGEEMDWKTFTVAMIIFNLFGIGAVFLLETFQHLLPLNPAGLGPVPADLAINTAVSFATNTNWQAYAGETMMSYLTQMLGLAVQNFFSAATGMAVLIGLIYALSRRTAQTIGNFWVLIIRSVMLLLPLSLIVAIALVSQGVVQTFSGPITVPLLSPVADENGAQVTGQVIPLGPAASQIAIKQLGTNGGGFFNTNSAHPFENPTPLSNFIELLAILLIPAALCYTFGSMIGSPRKGIALLVAMTLIFVPLAGLVIWAEAGGNPLLATLGIDQTPNDLQPGGNMEGKEVRFGAVFSALWSVATTAASNGSVNAMHDSFAPLSGFVQLLVMQLGEVVFGGVGSGLYGMIVFVIIAMFIAGLMVGRTPEYLGKKIEPYEMKLATLLVLLPIFVILIGTAIAAVVDAGKAAVFNPGPHGFSEILYAFTSATQNNGSAFAGLNANGPFYNISLAIAMLFGRYVVAILTLALAGSLVVKKIAPASDGTIKDHSLLFILWLVFVIVMIGLLSFIPALALGPIVEHLMITGGMAHV